MTTSPAERALHAGVAAEILQNSGLIVVVTELTSGSVVWINRATESLTGFESHEVEGRPVWETLIAPSDRVRVRAAYARADGLGTPSSYDGTLVTKSGYPRRVVWSTVFLGAGSTGPAYVAMTGIDVSSDRTDAGTFGHLMRAATTGACVATDLRGKVVFCSPGAEQLLGYTADELLGKTFPLDLFDPDEIEARAADLQIRPGLDVLARSGADVDRRRQNGPDLGQLDRRERARGGDRGGADTGRGGGGRRSLEWTLRRRDGSTSTISLLVHEVRHHREVEGYLALAEDVTDRQKTHDLLVAALEQEQEASQRVRDLDRTKSVFVATVSHELRTPTTSIAGYTELLQDESAGALTPEQRGFVEAIARNAERLRVLTDDLLILTSLETGTFAVERRPVDLRTVVETAQEQVRPLLATRRLEVAFDLPDTRVEVSGDGERLERVLMNLLGNAVKFTPDGGSVSCRLSVHDDRALLVVSDTGIGIPVDEQGELFTQFFRASSARERAIQGTGLGLSIVAAIVHSHDGTVWVESEHQQGACFTVSLPLLGTEQPDPHTPQES